MAETTYKKGELLFENTFETTTYQSWAIGMKEVSVPCTEEIIIIDFNGTEYTCPAIEDPEGYGVFYGGYSDESLFIDYPFLFASGGDGAQNYVNTLYTENPGTYTVKVYTAIEDTDSTPLFPTDFIIAYLMKSPQNSNWNVLSSLLGDGDWSRLKAYVETTPKNMNRQVLKALLGSGSSGSSAIVGTAVVGTNTVG